jgi:hypothetical protein
VTALRRFVLVLALGALVVPFAALADDSNPVITVPADMTVEAQNFSGAAVTYAVSAVDWQGRALPVTCNPPSGAGFGFGRTTVTCTARDSQNRTSTKAFHVTVVDRTPPVLSVPPNKRLPTANAAGTVATYSASASDLVDGPVQINCAPASGTLFPVGTTKVTCSAADRRGNASSAAFDVVVYFVRTVKRSTTMLSPAAGSRITTPPMLRWRAASKASFYNVQLFRRGHKILSAWPSRPSLRLRVRWTYAGTAYHLKPGSYSWLVWPAYGRPSQPRFGKLLGQSSFIVARKTRR